MARPVMLGNGQLTVGLNEYGLVHDFYYPYVGLDNLTTSRSVHHEIGVWIDGIFSWVSADTWTIHINSEADALVSDISMKNDQLQVELKFNDFVDPKDNAFCRRIHVHNLSDTDRDVRVFMHQVFQISRAGRADTALYVPDEHYILDYKGRCSLLISGQTTDGIAFDQFSIGNYGIEGKEGTYKDAEDGELTNNAVEHGGVDTVLRFVCSIPAHESSTIDYWVVAADSQYSAEKIHNLIRKDGLGARLDKTRDYWNDWLAVAKPRLEDIDTKYLEMTKKSLMVIKAHTDKRGGIIASCDSSIYNFGRDYYSYVWPRDGAYAIWPLIRLGYTHEPRRFFEFCRDILTPDGYLMHKYQPDKAIGSTWHPLVHGDRRELAIQEDETAGVLYMLGEYFDQSNDEVFVESLYLTLVQPAANFMAEFIDEQTGLPHPSYDLWEEKFLTTTYSSALVYQALLVAADFAETFEYPDDAVKWRDVANMIAKNSSVFFDPERKAFRKGFLLKEDYSLEFDNTLDVSSMYGVMMYASKDFGRSNLTQTIEKIEEILLDQSPSGGSPRYEHDNYFASEPPCMGNPWFVTTLWMAQYYVRTNQLIKARAYLDWTADKALPSGVLSEQVNPSTSEVISVTPLVWSHAEFINTALDLAKAENKLK
jgi:GH15 family glucan-1,4-alpha-glucosidase